MVHFTTFFALVVGGMELIQPTAAEVLAGLTARTAGILLKPVNLNTFQRRQTTGSIPQVPPSCQSTCDPVNTILSSGTCSPSQCCLPTFANSYFNCFKCVATSVNLTDYSQPQSIIDTLYDLCASLGIQLPVLTFPGQNPQRQLSSVVQRPQSTVTSISSTPASISIVQSTVEPPSTTATSPQATVTTQTPSPTLTPTPSSSSGTRTMGTSFFNFIASSIMLGTWFHFAI